MASNLFPKRQLFMIAFLTEKNKAYTGWSFTMTFWVVVEDVVNSIAVV